MKQVMVLTNMRTGSTWLTFLVRELLRRHAGFAINFKQVEDIWKRRGFVKAHKFTPEQVFERYPDAYIITSTRNPKGRTTSQFYFEKPFDEVKLNKVLKRSTKVGEQRQLDRMWEGFSSRNLEKDRKPHYMWTTFEWMKEDIYKETKLLCEFLGLSKSVRHINNIVAKTQRECESWGLIRKGVVDSWKDEYFKERLEILDKHQEMYYNRVNGELEKEE